MAASLLSCNLDGTASVTISTPQNNSARAISAEEKSAASLNVYFNDRLVATNISGSYTQSVATGTTLKVRVDALVDGKRIARGEETIRVRSGVNNVPIKLRENRAELKGTPQIGSIIMKDGSLRTAADIGNDTANAIAVVYKVASGKAWAVGKSLSSAQMSWADVNAQGYNKNITALQEEKGYTDGSKGLAILRSAVSDADDANLATNYPAWDYACNYGKNQRLDSFQTGWYLPSKQELQEVRNQKDNLPSALLNFGPNYWSSSQFYSIVSCAFTLTFASGKWDTGTKSRSYYVCAVRQFTY